MAVPSTLSQARPGVQQPLTRDEGLVFGAVAAVGVGLLLYRLGKGKQASASPPAVPNSVALPPIQTGPGDAGSPSPSDCGCG